MHVHVRKVAHGYDVSVSREAIAHRLPPPPPGLVYNEVLPVARLLHNDQPASKGMCRLLASVNEHLSRDDHDNLKRAVGDVAGGDAGAAREILDRWLLRVLSSVPDVDPLATILRLGQATDDVRDLCRKAPRPAQNDASASITATTASTATTATAEIRLNANAKAAACVLVDVATLLEARSRKEDDGAALLSAEFAHAAADRLRTHQRFDEDVDALLGGIASGAADDDRHRAVRLLLADVHAARST